MECSWNIKVKVVIIELTTDLLQHYKTLQQPIADASVTPEKYNCFVTAFSIWSKTRPDRSFVSLKSRYCLSSLSFCSYYTVDLNGGSAFHRKWKHILICLSPVLNKERASMTSSEKHTLFLPSRTHTQCVQVLNRLSLREDVWAHLHCRLFHLKWWPYGE